MRSAKRNGAKCVFFDRDGIVNHPPVHAPYVMHVDDLRIISEFVEALRVVNQKGYLAVIVTNQGGVGRGKMTEASLHAIHDALFQNLKEQGVTLDDILFCASPDDKHSHRKPNPGMLLEAAERHGIDLKASWMVGDLERDVIAGHRAGCRTVLVSMSKKATSADFRLRVMSELAGFLAKHL